MRDGSMVALVLVAALGSASAGAAPCDDLANGWASANGSQRDCLVAELKAKGYTVGAGCAQATSADKLSGCLSALEVKAEHCKAAWSKCSSSAARVSVGEDDVVVRDGDDSVSVTGAGVKIEGLDGAIGVTGSGITMTEGAATGGSKPAASGAAPGATLEGLAKADPVSCVGSTDIDVTRKMIKTDGDAVTTMGSCDITITGSHIAAKSVAIKIMSSADVVLEGCIVEGGAAAVSIMGSGTVKARNTRFKGAIQRLGTGEFVDLGGNVFDR